MPLTCGTAPRWAGGSASAAGLEPEHGDAAGGAARRSARPAAFRRTPRRQSGGGRAGGRASRQSAASAALLCGGRPARAGGKAAEHVRGPAGGLRRPKPPAAEGHQPPAPNEPQSSAATPRRRRRSGRGRWTQTRRGAGVRAPGWRPLQRAIRHRASKPPSAGVGGRGAGPVVEARAEVRRAAARCGPGRGALVTPLNLQLVARPLGKSLDHLDLRKGWGISSRS